MTQIGTDKRDSSLVHSSVPICEICVLPFVFASSASPEAPMRFLAIDLGDKRTGLAVGDDDLRIPSPLRVIERSGEALLDDIARAISDHNPDALVMGLPLNMDGTEGPRAKIVRAFAERLASRTHLPVHFHDERLSSDAADWQMAGAGLTRGQKKQRRDALAAAAILRDFLTSRAASTTEQHGARHRGTGDTETPP